MAASPGRLSFLDACARRARDLAAFESDDDDETDEEYEWEHVRVAPPPEGVTTLPDGAYYASTTLASVELPTGYTSVGANAFGYCLGLATVRLPA
eukprot:3270565-Prymnesium_polylepis.1